MTTIMFALICISIVCYAYIGIYFLFLRNTEKPKRKNKLQAQYILLPNNTTPDECVSEVDAVLIEEMIRTNDDPLQTITLKEVPAVKSYIKEYGNVYFETLPKETQQIIEAVWYISPQAYNKAVDLTYKEQQRELPDIPVPEYPELSFSPTEPDDETHETL